MQYLPQSQHASGIQYLQLIPTRPLIVPISSYLPAHPALQQQQQQQHLHPHLLNTQLQHQQQPQLYQHLPQPTNQQPSHYLNPVTRQANLPYANYAAAQSYLTAGQKYQPSQPLPLSTAQYPVYHSPTGGYAAASSAAPVVSQFRPHTGIQLVNGPLDMSLNTNEYIPVQNENSFKMRRA